MRHVFAVLGLVILGAPLAFAAGCGEGAPDYCDQCQGSAWACQNPDGSVACFATEDEASSSACANATHDIGKCD
jgi:hypothetical protein